MLFCVSDYSIAVRQSCTLQSGPLNVSSTHLAPYIVIMVCSIYSLCCSLHLCDYPVTTSQYFLISSSSPSSPRNPSPLWQPGQTGFKGAAMVSTPRSPCAMPRPHPSSVGAIGGWLLTNRLAKVTESHSCDYVT